MAEKIIKEILKHECFQEKPPVLVDVGASGKLRKIWMEIAPFSIYISFDADTRDMAIVEQSKGIYKKSFVINRIVADQEGLKKFYLTKDPHCSSTLEPDLESLSPYHIKSLFEIERIQVLPSVSLQSIFRKLDIYYVDWFKTDSQGTDLKIFKSMGEEYIKKVLVAELEPGILDAYKGEDKLHAIMGFFDARKDFWCDECLVRGMARFSEGLYKRLGRFERRFFYCFQKPCAFWAEISYMNSMNGIHWTKRDYLLMIAFAILKKQYGFALEIAERGEEIFRDQIFDKLKESTLKIMKINGYLNFPFYILKKILEKFL
jgi:hypothetical protein